MLVKLLINFGVGWRRKQIRSQDWQLVRFTDRWTRDDSHPARGCRAEVRVSTASAAGSLSLQLVLEGLLILRSRTRKPQRREKGAVLWLFLFWLDFFLTGRRVGAMEKRGRVASCNRCGRRLVHGTEEVCGPWKEINLSSQRERSFFLLLITCSPPNCLKTPVLLSNPLVDPKASMKWVISD